MYNIDLLKDTTKLNELKLQISNKMFLVLQQLIEDETIEEQCEKTKNLITSTCELKKCKVLLHCKMRDELQ